MSDNRQVPEGWGLTVDVTILEKRRVPLEKPNSAGNTFKDESRPSAEYPEQPTGWVYPDRPCQIDFEAVIFDIKTGRRIERARNSKDWPDFQWTVKGSNPQSGVEPRFTTTKGRNTVHVINPSKGGFFAFTLSANYGGEKQRIQVSGQVEEGLPSPVVSNEELIPEIHRMLLRLSGE